MKRYKYPRTYHLPQSQGMGPDDRRWSPEALEEAFAGKEVVVSEKLDGESATGYSDGYTHARSINSGTHRSRTWMKAFAAQIAIHLPEGWRVCGENCFATHSVGYSALPSYFLLFALYNNENVCLSWDETVKWAEQAEVSMVPEIYRGVFDLDAIQKSYTGASVFGDEAEGYVIRLADSFSYQDQIQCMAKMVRAGHVTTGEHWMSQAIVKNGLSTADE